MIRDSLPATAGESTPRLRHGLLLIALLAALVSTTACGGKKLQLPADSAGTPLFEQGQAYLEDSDWRRAIEAFDTLLRNYPASPHLPEARIGMGRAYYAQGREDSLILAIDAFENFLTYHPTHPNVDFAQFMIGMSYVKRMRSPDRDQRNTEAAIEAFRIFLEDYPDSSHAPEARAELQKAIDHRVEHELTVARWQLEDGRPGAARDRALWAMEHYPDTSLACELTFLLGESQRSMGNWGEAVHHYEEVLENHPDCEYARKARERLRERPSAG